MLDLESDPYANDPGHWGASLAVLADLVVACLDAAGARSVVEVGAYAGDLTRVLADRAAAGDGRVWAIDPAPRQSLVELAEQHAHLELVRSTSFEALPHLPLADAAIIDGDHNYYTVSEELRLIAASAEGGTLPLLLLHDVCWPHARRDSYFDPTAIPEAHRRPMGEGVGLYPGEPGVKPGALPFRWAASEEGGERNGVLTAVEDFLADRAQLRLAIVPAFFGLGVVWDTRLPWSDAVEELLRPWDRNELLERLEANRVLHLSSAHVQWTQAIAAQTRLARQEGVLRRLLQSSAFSVAERLSRLRHRAGIATGQRVVSKDEIRRALADD
jgi:SAM-dependent methyltransferase